VTARAHGVRDTTRRHLRVALMVPLTFVSGLVDAVGYLALDRVFAGNMTGNVARLKHRHPLTAILSVVLTP
jgi:uncharacterized protein DUF1275